MRLKASTDFGLRTLMRLASQSGAPSATGAMARELAISRNHLTKVVQALAGGGFLSTRRGAGGGFALAKPAAEISVGEVVRHLESDQALVECFRPDGGACTLTPDCRLKGQLAAAREAFLATLDGVTLAECAYPAGDGARIAEPRP